MIDESSLPSFIILTNNMDVDYSLDVYSTLSKNAGSYTVVLTYSINDYPIPLTYSYNVDITI